MTTTPPTREELVALCERGVVPEEKWNDRDSASAQIQLGKAWVLLRAGCEFRIADDPVSDEDVWWVEITYKGFNYVEGTLDGPGEPDVTTRYIPTAARLDKVDGADWYC